MKPALVFDIETQRTFDEIKGLTLPALRVSVAVSMDLDSGAVAVYREHEAPQLVEALLNARLVVGFNHEHFDLKVLGGYGMPAKCPVPSFDILKEVQRQLGYRVKLDSICNATLGTKKAGDGLDAVRWFRAGEWDTLIHYCTEDVRLTAEVLRHGLDKGWVAFDKGGRHQRLQVDWRRNVDLARAQVIPAPRQDSTGVTATGGSDDGQRDRVGNADPASGAGAPA